MSVQITDVIIKISGVQVVKAQEVVVAAIDGATATAIGDAGADGIAAGGFADAATRKVAMDNVDALIIDVADIRTKMNSLLTKLKAHGLIASS